jgi:formate C-acetyltransferase
MGGASMNLRLSPAVLQSKEERGRFEDLLKGYFQLGGQQLQLNVIDTETLREAQAHHQRFQDLFVRVTGYSARFVDLTEGTQEEIIQRTEMQACR